MKSTDLSFAAVLIAAWLCIGCHRSAHPPKESESKGATGQVEISKATIYDASRDHPFFNSLGMKFVPVPGTEVLFGVWLTRVQDFEAFVTATGHDATKGTFSVRADGTKTRGDNWKSPGFSQGPAHPVCGVNWKDADAFCSWLTKKERAEGQLTAAQSYRLPKDWEWSVGVGLSEPRDGLPKDKDRVVADIYPWGTKWPPPDGVANYAGEEVKGADWPDKYTIIEGYRDGYARTSPVGSFAPNQFGLRDMGGNVWQWCDDWFDAEQQKRVLRGSSWRNSDPRDLLSSYRFNRSPQTRVTDFGFRCVLVR